MKTTMHISGWTRLTLLASLVLVGLNGCAPPDNVASTSDNTALAAAKRRVRVELLELRPARFVDWIEVTGTVEAEHDATLSAQASGTVEYLAPLGSQVAAGAVLARLDQTLARAALKQAEAQLASARAAYELALDNFRRQEPLFRDSIISALEFENVRTQRDQAAAQLRLAEAAVEQARKQLAHTVIQAPFAGTVEAHFVDVGEQIAMGQPVLRLVNLHRVKVRAGVPERYARDIRVGTPVALHFQAYGLPARQATVSFVGNTIDPANRTFPIEVHLDNPDGQLKPEMVVRVRLARQVLDHVAVIPLPAVLRDETGTSVFVADTTADGLVARQRYITLGPSAEGLVVVTQGLRFGERVVVLGQNDLSDGDLLEVLQTYTTAARAADATTSAPGIQTP
ncbi:efflux RND transporter periplasmic adaptor subunit [Rhodothermus profundi]|uniref:Membrane fusion protein, multidrug efflux system n=1 Tax=Rhodothermus profundi TaxID=633813 RepID=A0A1M6QKE1_9BACT|nr:efflux RND transporter periplasmic adaptor subunit [Rhodothermus profundi]SHK20711.1 membrane fusion protein, multidrug efflux system [Rhodothermus profundi]